MKGVILAGGTGSRLYPMTISVNKQLIPVYDKPMIYYPLANLISFGIKDVCIISSSYFIDQYESIFRDGSRLGMSISYKIQEKPKGIAESLIIAESFIKNSKVCLVLGDNIFHGISDIQIAANGATIFAYEVRNPSAYGVINFDSHNKPTSIQEKPSFPSSKFAVPGLYFYDENATEYAKTLTPSARGELEITDLNNLYLRNNKMTVCKLKKGSVWLDAGTPESLFQSSAYIQTIQSRQGLMVGCIEEEAFKRKFINKDQLRSLIDKMPESEYKEYIRNYHEQN